jgi:hypothetical protein
MSSQVVRLPARFPVGTRYVIEGRAGRIQLRFLEFPDGRRVDMPADPVEQGHSRAITASHRRAPVRPGRKF